MLISVQSRVLSSVILLPEIKEALDSIHDAKSLRADGFSAKIFKLHWDQIKEDLFSAITCIFQSGHNAKGLNQSYFFNCYTQEGETTDSSRLQAYSLCQCGL